MIKPAVVAGAGFALAGCVEEQELFDVTLQFRMADAVEEAIAGRDDTLNAGYVDDLGNANGIDVAAGRRVAFDPAAQSVAFELLALAGDNDVLGLGRSGVVDVPDVGDALVVPMLITTVDAVGAVEGLPPDLGDGGCVTADERGRVFLVGGSDAGQSGYVFGDDLQVVGLADADSFRGKAGVGCSALGGRVVAAGGSCGAGDAIGDIVISNGDRADVVDVASGVIDCAAFVAPSRDGYWVIDANATDLLDAEGSVTATGPAVVAVDVEPAVNGDVLVLTDSDAVLVRRDSPESHTTLGLIDRVGRRFDDVVALRGSSLLLLEGNELVELRNDVDVGTAASFTVLSDNTVVAIVGVALHVSRPGADTQVLALARPRTHVSALPGDTVVLAGGSAGVDAISFSKR